MLEKLRFSFTLLAHSPTIAEGTAPHVKKQAPKSQDAQPQGSSTHTFTGQRRYKTQFLILPYSPTPHHAD